MRSYPITAILLFALSAGLACAAEKTESTLTFKVSGLAEAFPKTAKLKFAISGEGETLEKAQAQLLEQDAAIWDLLAGYGSKREQASVEHFVVSAIQPTKQTDSALASSALSYRIQREYRVPVTVTADKLDGLVEMANAVFANGAKLSLRQDRPQYTNTTNAAVFEFTLASRDELLEQALDDGVRRARKLAEHTVKDIPGARVQLRRVNVSETKTMPDYGYSNTLPASGIWQPVQMTLTVEATFGYD